MFDSLDCLSRRKISLMLVALKRCHQNIQTTCTEKNRPHLRTSTLDSAFPYRKHRRSSRDHWRTSASWRQTRPANNPPTHCTPPNWCPSRRSLRVREGACDKGNNLSRCPSRTPTIGLHKYCMRTHRRGRVRTPCPGLSTAECSQKNQVDTRCVICSLCCLKRPGICLGSGQGVRGAKGEVRRVRRRKER